MKPKYFQFSCRETKKLDLRQAKAVLKYKPDIIILEYPNNDKTPDFSFNKYSALKKPTQMVKKILKPLPAKVLKLHPWAQADTIMWQNIVSLWQQGHQVLVYKVDAPSELTKELLYSWPKPYPAITDNWRWWVQIYLRERIMANNIKWILKNYRIKKIPTALIFLQSFHWDHVKFLLTNPSKAKIWNYYFGKFPEISQSDIALKIKKFNKVFYKYWRKYSNFNS